MEILKFLIEFFSMVFDLIKIIINNHKELTDVIFVLISGIVGILKILAKRKDLPEVLQTFKGKS